MFTLSCQIWVAPDAAVQCLVGGPFILYRNTEHTVECAEGVEPSVEPEDVFIQVCLEVILTHAMVGAEKPRFQITEHQVNHRKVLFCSFRVAFHDNRVMPVSQFSNAVIALPAIGADQCARRDVGSDESFQCVGLSVGGHLQSHSPGISWAFQWTTALMIFASSGRTIFTLSTIANLDSTNHDSFVVDTTSLATRPTAHVSLVNLNRVFSADRIMVGSHHGCAKFMKHLEHRLVTRDSELALDLKGGHSRRLGSYEKSSPEPHRERRPSFLHDRASRKRSVTLALSTSKNRRTINKAIGIALPTAETADEPFRPAQRFKVGRAVLFIRKHVLHFQQRCRELKPVDHLCSTNPKLAPPSGLCQILQVVVLGVNRIGMLQTGHGLSYSYSNGSMV